MSRIMREVLRWDCQSLCTCYIHCVSTLVGNAIWDSAQSLIRFSEQWNRRFRHGLQEDTIRQVGSQWCRRRQTIEKERILILKECNSDIRAERFQILSSPWDSQTKRQNHYMTDMYWMHWISIEPWLPRLFMDVAVFRYHLTGILVSKSWDILLWRDLIVAWPIQAVSRLFGSGSQTRPCRSERARKRARRLQDEIKERNHLVSRLVEVNQASAYAASLQADLNKDLLSLAFGSQTRALPSITSDIPPQPPHLIFILLRRVSNNWRQLKQRLITSDTGDKYLAFRESGGTLRIPR